MLTRRWGMYLLGNNPAGSAASTIPEDWRAYDITISNMAAVRTST
jgi:hypothetical protein